jgi:ABC-type nitrate/sulfonate/bicarbonate transport system ATPase subunit
MIRLEDVTYTYTQDKTGRQPRPGGTAASIFQDYRWEVQRGEAWSVLGPSGCGKTTLLYLLAGLRFPTAGQILIDGHRLTRPRPHTGLILQDYGLLPWATVRQNAELGLSVRAFYGPDGTHAPADFRPRENAAPWLERLGLVDIQDKYPGQISGGQRQRTAIARTLTLQPDLLLMDEPFSSLDAPTRQGLQNLAREIWSEQRLTMVVVTHAIEEAAVLGGKILLLKNPPNRTARIFDNPGAADPAYPETHQYLNLCRELRQAMETE